MGVEISLYVGPRDQRSLTEEEFRKLVIDLIASEIVAPPAALIQGRMVQANKPEEMLWETRSGVPPFTPWRGKRSKALLEALAQAPYGKQQLAVAFEGLWLKNKTLAQELERSGRGALHVGLVAYALRKPTDVHLYEYDSPDPPRRMKVQHCVALWGPSGVEEIAEIPSLRTVLARHFGALVEGCSAI